MIWIVNIELTVFATWQTDMNAVFKGIMKRDTGQEIERCVARYFGFMRSDFMMPSVKFASRR
jgi:hypothetical protein